MSGKMIWADEDGLHKREIFLLVWSILLCVALFVLCVCWYSRCLSGQPRQGSPRRRIIAGGGEVQVHVAGQANDDDDDEDSDPDDTYKRRRKSSPMGTTIYFGPNQRRRRTRGRVFQRGFTEV